MLEYQPHGYQERAAQFIIDTPGCGLFIDLGLGKTVTTLTAMATLLGQCEVRRLLVIAPKRVADHTWPAEVTKWAHTRHLRVVNITGTPKQRARALGARADVWLVNRENVVWLVKTLGQRWPFDAVVIDESTSFKDSSTARWKALRKVRGLIRRMVLLTGTPISNGLLDLWAQLYLIDGGQRLGRTFTGFRDAWFSADYMGYKWTPKAGAQAAIESRVADVVLTLRAEDWLQMPDKIEVDVPVELPPDVLRAYRTLEREGLLELAGGEVTAASAAALANKLAQAAAGCLYDEQRRGLVLHDAKLDALDELLEAAGGPVLVAYSFRTDVDRIKARHQHAREAREDGAIDAWNRGEVPLLLIHPASGGYGLNLQHGGRHLVWFGLTWSLEQYLQTNARLHRQGQRHTVIVHRLVCRGTIDQRIADLLAGKHTSLAALMRALAYLPADER